MKMILKPLLMICMLGPFAVCQAEEDAAPTLVDSAPTLKTIVEAPSKCMDHGHILDPDIALADKSRDLDLLRASADAGDNLSQYLMGTFYRLGESHPAKIFVQDSAKAKVYLSNAAVNGSYSAMAAMAEMELKDKNYREAMLWAQVFAHYSGLDKNKGNQAYQAYLLQRIMQFTGKDKKQFSDEIFRTDLIAFHSQYNKQILEAAARNERRLNGVNFALCLDNRESTSSSPVSLLGRQDTRADAQTIRKISTPGYAFYFLKIDSQGRVAKAMVVDSSPDMSYAEALSRVAMKLKYNAIDSNRLRSVYQPVAYDDFSVAIKNDEPGK